MDRKRMKKLISILTVAAIFSMSFASAFSVSAEGAPYTIGVDDVTEAILYDHTDGAEAPENVVGGGDYDVVSSLREDGKIEVAITATDVKLHKNNAGTPTNGYWVGFAVEGPQGATHAEGTFGGILYEENVGGINEDGDMGVAFYINAGVLNPKTEATLTWFNGEDAISEEVTFIIKIDGVTLDVDYAVEENIGKAIIADTTNPTREVYAEGTYEVSYADGVVSIDMEKLELHKNDETPAKEGFWTGFSVEAPVGATFAKYTFGETTDTTNVTDIDGNEGDKEGIAFYTDAANPTTSAKLQWFEGAADGENSALSNPIELTINLDGVDYYKVVADDVTEAILKDNAAEPVTTLFDEYEVNAEGEGVINVAILAENVVKHENENHTDGYWVGFAVKAPEGAKKADINFGEDIYSNEPVINIDGNGTEGIAFYINAGDAEPKTEATLQWIAENGETLSDVTSFNIDLSSVSFAVDYTLVIDKANVVDKDATEREIYKADSYIVTPTTKENGTILVDIAMQELAEHTNGDNDEGYWTGFAVEAPYGATGMKYAFGTSKDLALSEVKSLEENVIDAKSGIAFYANMADAEPMKYAKLQWYNGTEAISNVMTFEMNLDDVKLNWIKADEKISKAELNDTSETPVSTICTDYDVDATQMDDTITVAITAKDVVKHKNADSTSEEGYWVGFEVEAPSTDAKMKYAFGEIDELSLGVVKELETISENKKGIAFYTNAGALVPKLYATLQWFAVDGVTPLSAPTKFVVDISGVTLASLPYITADKVGKANVVDQANTSVQPYVTYSAVGAANENAVIVVDIDMTDLKAHKNGQNTIGHWTGFSVTAPDGAVSMRYAFSQTREGLSSMQKADLNGENQVSFYANKADAQPKKFVRLQWFDENGAAITNATDFEMDLSDVQLYVAPQPPRGGGSGSVNYYTVSFNSNGGSTVASAKVKKEGTVSAPGAPVKDGFVFDGWYTDKDLTQKYDFSSVVTKSFTLYAKWTKAEGEATGLKFIDIKKDAWYYDVVKTIVEKGLMNGISETEFAPELEVTRGMFVTILYRAAGAPQVAKTSNFADVSADTYYAKAVAWASANGIVNGITENKFAPDYNITREQMAAILYRYAKNENKSGEITYTDKDAISDYALDATAWANAAGIMKGNEDGTFAPLRNASRAEAAAVFARLLKL